MASAMETETTEPEQRNQARQANNNFPTPLLQIDRSGGRTVVEVAGDDLQESDVAGWTFQGKRSKPGRDGTGEQNFTTNGSSATSTATSKRDSPSSQARFARRITARMTKAARMPSNIPRDEHKIIVRPRGGLNTGRVEATALMAAIGSATGIPREEAMQDTVCANVAQNIIVLSTPCERRAVRYAQLRALKIGDQIFEASAYHAAPSGTAKGVIYHVAASETPEDIRANIVNKNNPAALDAHRIGDTHAVIVLFEGLKVPATIKYGSVIVRCSLYRQHHQVCRRCGKVGHRTDVCPYPQTRICFACGTPNPGIHHEEQCKPHCKLCGGPHPTGAPGCGNRYKIPYQVKRRRWERSQKESDFLAAQGIGSKSMTPRDGGRENSCNRSRSKLRAASKRRKASRSQEKVKWTDVVMDNTRQSRNRSKSSQRRNATQPQQEEINKLKEENRRLNQRLDELLKHLENPQKTTPAKQQQPQKAAWEQGRVPKPQSLTPRHQRQEPQQEDAETLSQPSTSSGKTTANPRRESPRSTSPETDMEEGKEEDNEDAELVATEDASISHRGGCSTNCAVRFRRYEKRHEKLELRVDTLSTRIDRLSERVGQLANRFEALEQFLYRKFGGDEEIANACKLETQAKNPIWPGLQTQNH